MSDEWIKFSDRQPLDGQLIWPGNYERVTCSPVRHRTGDDVMPYTHWKPCVQPDPPKKPLPELPDGFVFRRYNGNLAIYSVDHDFLVVFYDDTNGRLKVELTARDRPYAAVLVAALDEAEKCQ